MRATRLSLITIEKYISREHAAVTVPLERPVLVMVMVSGLSMAAGRPIVATAVGAIPEVVGGDGAAMLVHPDDPTELAAAMAELMRDPGRRDAMSLAGRRRQADFSWKAAAATVASIYERLLAGRYPTEPGRGG